MESPRGSSLLLLFAPKFRRFGSDVGKEYLRRTGGGKIHGLCTGPYEVMSSVQNSLGSEAGKFWHLHTEEKKWLKEDISFARLARIDDMFGSGVLGRVMVADRRIGRGFVRGGLCRPDDFGQEAVHAPDIIPQRYILGLFQFLENVLRETKPDVVFCYAVAGGPAVALAELCKTQKIPFTRLNTVRIKNRYVIDDDIKGRLGCIERRYHSALNSGTELKNRREESRLILEEFRRSPEAPGYMKRNYARLLAQKPWDATGKAFLESILHLGYLVINKSGRGESIARIWFEVWTRWKRAFIGSRVFAEHRPKNRRFIYFPLHVDPEASTMVLSPWHTDQVNVIESIAKSAPSEMIVVVKEHLPMLGKRPRHFYKTISRIPRVILLGPDHNGLSLVQQADLTVVITGTAAWEAILLGKPALVIGDSPYLAIGQGVLHEPCLANLSDAIPKALSLSPASDEALELYLSACLEESFEMPSSLLWERYENHPESVRQKAVQSIVEGIIKRVQEYSAKEVRKPVQAEL